MKINYDILYNKYVKNCKKNPKSFSDFIRIYTKIIFHRQIIRPQIIWWQETYKIMNTKYYKNY